MASNLKIEVKSLGVQDLIVLFRRLGFTSAAVYYFILACFYRRRSIVKAGAAVGGV